MRLRTRLCDELQARLVTHLPEAVETVWDHAAVTLVLEQIKFVSAGGLEDDWARLVTFDGMVKAELRADRIDDLVMEPLIADLLQTPMFVTFDPGAPTGVSEKARAKLIECRDAVRDQNVVSALRFEVKGTLAQLSSPPPRPVLMVAQAPEIGLDHSDDYADIVEASR